MPSRKSRSPVKGKIPWVLYMAIIGLQTKEDLNWEEACIRAAELVDVNSEEFEKAKNVEANRIYKRRHMTETNKEKPKWIDRGYEKGKRDYCITFPCSACGEELVIKPGSEDHEALKKMLNVSRWAHPSCEKKD